MPTVSPAAEPLSIVTVFDHELPEPPMMRAAVDFSL